MLIKLVFCKTLTYKHAVLTYNISALVLTVETVMEAAPCPPLLPVVPRTDAILVQEIQ